MIEKIIKKWDENKFRLEEYFRTTNQEEYSQSYKQILEKVINLVINYNVDDEDDEYDTSKITVVDDGHYQGTLIFIIPTKTYHPTIEDYIITNVYYGSCSGCDTLKRISNYDDELPTDEQVKEYMMLALHLVQKMKKLTE